MNGIPYLAAIRARLYDRQREAPMFTITKDFTFSASHLLEGLPDDHPCSRLHGHNYQVRIELQSDQLSQIGFVYDYRGLDDIKQFIDHQLDHRHLNDVVSPNPTAEHLAQFLHRVAKSLLPNSVQVTAVSVSETPKTWATYREVEQ